MQERRVNDNHMEEVRLGKTLLVSGGKIDIPFAKEYLAKQSFDIVVCADRGLDAAFTLHLPVQYFLGDFDSVEGKVLEQYRYGKIPGSEGAKWIQYPTKKDHTDTQLALEWILKRHPSEIVILGATGGRFDHFLANVHVLMLPLEKGIPTSIIDSYNRIRLMKEEMEIHKEDMYGNYLSLIPLTSKVSGVTLEGLEYPLNDAELTIGNPYAVSNELVPGSEAALIRIREGVLVVIESKD